jgi:hypothetical protein
MQPPTQNILGQESWTLRVKHVEAAVTRQAGHLAPVRFRVGRRWVAPLAVAPWAEEKLAADTPPVVRVMRGDFFCLPFGGNGTTYRGEKHPVHGETANGRWKLESLAAAELHASLCTSVRPGRVDKFIRLVSGQPVVYQRHVISGMSGRICCGHHAMLKVPDGVTARVSVSPFRLGRVFPGQLENPARGGYSILQPGARFTTLTRVPRQDGGRADLSVWPAREGYEDLVQLAAVRRSSVAWTALTMPEERYAWFAFKDPQVLPSTVLWMSNGGRHYPPWSGRHRRTIGLEEVLANFHHGLAESAKPNAWTRAGVPTSVRLDPHRPLTINTIMGVAEIPAGFDVVADIRFAANQKSAILVARSGRSVSVAVDLSFLAARDSTG